ncbi:MAG TPA: hypothetical protein PKD09_22415 [Aggregatilinea sp.]|uniref:hypothetical protein n=1 Tax=Aggregatilinea sp. TaxID=2806333 RepID=UPI002CE0D6E6|nr:hypothetical protein [Aggregatilinea sp.]HML24425.1 hypothetical protein [Aggregatilinea sp.]
MNRTRTRLLYTILATVIIWAGVAAIKLLSPDEDLITFGLIVGFGSTVALWLVWTFSTYQSEEPEQKAEKAKRAAPTVATAPDDARIALLLQLMDDEDRRELKRRLMDEVSADGESMALADLLAAQDERILRAAGR